MEFTARIIAGDGRGRTIGFPTLNLEPTDIPTGMEPGVYAATVLLGDDTVCKPAAVHHGPRPTVGASPSTEVHVIDEVINDAPGTITVHLGTLLRSVESFDSIELLAAQLQQDIEKARSLFYS